MPRFEGEERGLFEVIDYCEDCGVVGDGLMDWIVCGLIDDVCLHVPTRWWFLETRLKLLIESVASRWTRCVTWRDRTR